MTTSHSNYLGRTPEQLSKLREKEDAARLACGARLGLCHLMAETVDWMLEETVNGTNTKRLDLLISQPWCRQTIKMNLKEAVKELRRAIKTSRRNSLSDHDYVNEVSDNMYCELKPALFKLYNAFLIELGRPRFKTPCDKGPVAYMVLIMHLLRWIANYYDENITYMKNVFPGINYDYLYSNNRCTRALDLWTAAVDEFASQHIEGVVNLNDAPAIVNGLAIVDKTIRSDEVACRITEGTEGNEARKNEDMITQAFKTLGIE